MGTTPHHLNKRRGSRSAAARRRRLAEHRAAQKPSPGAAAAERASAGMGTADAEPTDWLFGDILQNTAARSQQ